MTPFHTLSVIMTIIASMAMTGKAYTPHHSTVQGEQLADTVWTDYSQVPSRSDEIALNPHEPRELEIPLPLLDKDSSPAKINRAQSSQRRTKRPISIPEVQWAPLDQSSRKSGTTLKLCVRPSEVPVSLPRTRTWNTAYTCGSCATVEPFQPFTPSLEVLGQLQQSNNLILEIEGDQKIVSKIQTSFYSVSSRLAITGNWENEYNIKLQDHYDKKLHYPASNTRFDSPSQLKDGIEVSGELDPTQSDHNYYQFTPTEPNIPELEPVMQVYMTPWKGDPDLVASTKSSQPDIFNNMWESLENGDDAILIFNRSSPYAWPQTLFIGVSGVFCSETCTYTLVAKTRYHGHMNATSQLNLDELKVGSVDSKELRYFNLHVLSDNSEDRLSVRLNLLYGTSNIFVAKAVDNHLRFPEVIYRNGYAIVDESTYDKRGRFNGAQMVADFTLHKGSNNFTVAVFGEESFNTFQLQASLGRLVTFLPFDETREDSVAAESYTYYRLNLTEDKTDIAIQAISDRHLHLYAAYNGVTHVNTSNEQKSAVTGFDGIANILIKYKDLSDACKQNISHGGCHIAVSAYSIVDANYTIEASYSNSTERPLPLPVSETYVGMLVHGHYDYFNGSFNTKNGTIHINLLTWTGDADLFVTLGDHPEGFGRYHYNYSSREYGPGLDSISIYADDEIRKKECSCQSAVFCPCTVRISVYDFDRKSLTVYSLLVETNDTITSLPNDGRTVSGATDPGHSEWYRVHMHTFNIFDPKDLEIEADVNNGEVQLLAVEDDGKAPPTLPHPDNKDTYTWKTSPDESSIALRIPHSDPNACHHKTGKSECAYIIGVHSTSMVAATFTISASILDPGPKPNPNPDVISLIGGQPKTGEVAFGEWEYYYFDWSDSGNEDVYVSWKVLSGLGIEILFSKSWSHEHNEGKYLPPSTHCRDPIRSNDGDIHFKTSDRCYNKSSHILAMGVKEANESAVGSGLTEFTLTATTGGKAIKLVPGEPTAEMSLTRGQMMYFKLSYHAVVDILITPTILQGHVNALISNDTSKPWPSCTEDGSLCKNFLWTTDRTLQINHTHPCRGTSASRNCTGAAVLRPRSEWIIGVVAASKVGKSVFTLSYDEPGSIDNLAEGVPFATETRRQLVCPHRDSDGTCGPSKKSETRRRPVAFLSFKPGEQMPHMITSIMKNCSDSRCPAFTVSMNVCGGDRDCNQNDRYPLKTSLGGNVTYEFNVADRLVAKHIPTEYLHCGDGKSCQYYLAVYSETETLHNPDVGFRVAVMTDRRMQFLGVAQEGQTMEPQPIYAQNPGALHTFEVLNLDSESLLTHIQAKACRSKPHIYVCYRSDKGRCSKGETRPGPDNYVAKSSFNEDNATAAIKPFELNGPLYISVHPFSGESSTVETIGNARAMLEMSFGKAGPLKHPTQKPEVHVKDDSDHTVDVSWSSVAFTNGRKADITSFAAFLALQKDVNSVSNYYLGTSCGFLDAWNSSLKHNGQVINTGSKMEATFKGLDSRASRYTVFVMANCSDKCIGSASHQSIVFPAVNVSESSGGDHGKHSGAGAGAIAGGTIGALIGVAIVVILGIWYLRRRRGRDTAPVAQEFTSASYQRMSDDGPLREQV